MDPIKNKRLISDPLRDIFVDLFYGNKQKFKTTNFTNYNVF